jgi:hypothetical protein
MGEVPTMQVAEMEHSEEVAPRDTVRVWIESGDGSIARGVVEVLSEDGAFVRLTDAASVDTAEVAVRLSCALDSATLGLAARVLWVLSTEEDTECEIEWMPGPDRAKLAPLIATLGEG